MHSFGAYQRFAEVCMHRYESVCCCCCCCCILRIKNFRFEFPISLLAQRFCEKKLFGIRRNGIMCWENDAFDACSVPFKYLYAQNAHWSVNIHRVCCENHFINATYSCGRKTINARWSKWIFVSLTLFDFWLLNSSLLFKSWRCCWVKISPNGFSYVCVCMQCAMMHSCIITFAAVEIFSDWKNNINSKKRSIPLHQKKWEKALPVCILISIMFQRNHFRQSKRISFTSWTFLLWFCWINFLFEHKIGACEWS